MQNKKTYSVSGNGIAIAKSNTVTFDYTGLDDTTVSAMCGPFEQNEVIRLQGVDRKLLRANKPLWAHTIIVRDGRVRGTRGVTVVVREMTTDEMLTALVESGTLNDEMVAAITAP
jgi:hypothetical protein